MAKRIIKSDWKSLLTGDTSEPTDQIDIDSLQSDSSAWKAREADRKAKLAEDDGLSF